MGFSLSKFVSSIPVVGNTVNALDMTKDLVTGQGVDKNKLSGLNPYGTFTNASRNLATGQDIGTGIYKDAPQPGDGMGNLNSSDPYAGIWNMRPDFNAPYDPNTMSTEKSFKELDPMYSTGLNRLREEATRKGGSGWLHNTQMMNALNEKDARDKGAQEVGGQTGVALSKLASQGGLSSGARERVAEQGQRNFMDMSQGASRTADMNDLSAAIQDEGNRMNALSQLPGAEQNRMSGWLNAKTQDNQNLMNNTNLKNQWNMDLYKERSGAYAADKQAQATANSGGGGCFITTAMCDYFGLPDDCRELTLMRRLRDDYALEDIALTKEVIEYYKLAGKVDAYLREIIDPKVWETIKNYIQKSAHRVDCNQFELAYETYKELVAYVKEICAPALNAPRQMCIRGGK